MTNIESAALHNAPTHIKQAVMAIRSVNTELHEHTHTVHGIKDLVLVLTWKNDSVADNANSGEVNCKQNCCLFYKVFIFFTPLIGQQIQRALCQARVNEILSGLSRVNGTM